MRIKLPKLVGLDRRSLSVFRIAFGLVLLFSLYLRISGGQLETHYTEKGFIPIGVVQGLPTRWSFLDSFSNPSLAPIAFLLIFCVYSFYIIGWKTRIQQVLVVLILVSLRHRNPFIEDGSDMVLRFFAVWTAFLPIGDFFSVDAYQKKRGNQTSFHALEYCSLATAGFTINLAASYLLNAIHKNSTLLWQQGTAIYTILWDGFFVAPLGVFVRTYDPLSLCYWITKISVWTEYLLGFSLLFSLVSSKGRLAIVLGIFGLHLGIGLLMSLGHFSLIYYAVCLIFIPAWVWDRYFPNIAAVESETLSSAANIKSKMAPYISNFLTALTILVSFHTIVINNFAFPEPFKRFVDKGFPDGLKKTEDFFEIHQRWWMFHDPFRSASNLALTATFPGRGELDTLHGYVPVDFKKLLIDPKPMNKYGKIFLVPLSSYGVPGAIPYLANYFFSRGAREVAVYTLLAPIPPRGSPLNLKEMLVIPKYRLMNTKVIDFKPELLKSVPSGSRTGLQDMEPFGHAWNNNNQFYMCPSEVGGEAVFKWDSTISEEPEVNLIVTHAPDHGIYKVYWNNHYLKEINLYETIVVNAKVPLGRVPIRQGENTIGFILQGKDEHSSNTILGLDCLEIFD